MSDGGALLPLPSLHVDPTWRANDPPEPLVIIDSRKQAWQRLVGRTAPQDELPSLIEAIFSGRKATEMVDCLRGDDAQVFIDIIDGVRHHALQPQEME